MKRMHVHTKTKDLDGSIAFYSAMFGAEPVVVKTDYAKWQLDDPRVNFAISLAGCGASEGIEHLGIQAENPEELAQVYAGLAKADQPVLEEGKTTCCYARSEKSWVRDPNGIVWEAFFTDGEATVYGDPGPVAKGALSAPETTCCPTM